MTIYMISNGIDQAKAMYEIANIKHEITPLKSIIMRTEADICSFLD